MIKSKLKICLLFGMILRLMQSVQAGWIDVKGEPGNANTVCGYLRPGGQYVVDISFMLC